MNFMTCDDGATAVEYGIFVSFIALFVAGAYTTFSEAFVRAATEIITAISV
jgi:Flp pilus assembly pilin Flp